VRRFLPQSVASLAVLGGLALPSAGPRAAAGMLYLAGPGAADDLGGTGQGPAIDAVAEPGSPTLVPAGPQDSAPFSFGLGLTCRSVPATAGSSARGPTGSPDRHNALLPGPAPVSPPPTGFLRVRPGLDPSDPVPSSIFHPPRLPS
jgi:hypothetical protein